MWDRPGCKEPDRTTIKSQICRMRKQIAPLGMRIRAVYEIGYVLERDE